jgi:hypothetical protein
MRGRALGVLSIIATVVAGATVAAQRARSAGPPVPFEDVGACPFEGCAYRDWIANTPVRVLTDRRTDAPVAFTVKRGERVHAITGVVITQKAGRVQFRKAVDLDAGATRFHVEPGQTLYLLTYRGEGFSVAWFQGRRYDEVDVSEFFNALCDEKPGECNGRIIERPRTVWWIRLRNMKGLTGWSREPEKFDNKDALGG